MITRILRTLTDEELDTLSDAAEAEQRRRKDADDERRREAIRAGRGDPGPRRGGRLNPRIDGGRA